MNPFEAYAKQANTIVNQPAKLVGPLATRSEARVRYDEIVAGLRSCLSIAGVEEELEIRRAEIAQFHAELPFYWEGEGDFPGLRKEIALAQARVDAGLDFPRWDVEANHSELSLFQQEGNGQ